MRTSSVVPELYEYKRVQYDFKEKLGYYPRIQADLIEEAWGECSQLAFDVMRSDLDDGWEVDPSSWGIWAFKYQSVSGGWSTWGCVAWAVYIFLMPTVITIFILPFMGKNVFVLEGFEVRLQKLKQSGM